MTEFDLVSTIIRTGVCELNHVDRKEYLDVYMTGVLSFLDPSVSDTLYKFAKAFINLEHFVCYYKIQHRWKVLKICTLLQA